MPLTKRQRSGSFRTRPTRASRAPLGSAGRRFVGCGRDSRSSHPRHRRRRPVRASRRRPRRRPRPCGPDGAGGRSPRPSDAGLRRAAAADSIRVVSLLSWRYRNPARFVAARLGLRRRETGVHDDRRQQPAVAGQPHRRSTSRRGELDVAILDRRRVLADARCAPARPGSSSTGRRRPTATNRVTIGERPRHEPAGRDRRAASYMPVQVYPMFETALRAAAGADARRAPRPPRRRCGPASAHVAAGNPYAWIRDAKSRRGDPHAQRRRTG